MTAYAFQFVAGRLCLDFINTLGDRGNGSPNEHLSDYAELVRWAESAGAIEAGAVRRLRRAAQERPRVAQRVLGRAVSLREALYRLFTAARQDEAPAGEDLSLFNRELGNALAHARIQSVEGAYALSWADDPAALDRPLWPVVRSAADLLATGELGRIKSCASDTCNWVFMDESRNRSRQWCQMEVCGNRAKARRHYARSKSRGDRASRT